MKTILFITAMLLSCSIYSQEEKENEEKNQENTRETPQMVYICNSMSSKRYHYKKDCAGLKNCKDSIVKVSIRKAKTSKELYVVLKHTERVLLAGIIELMVL